MIIGVCSTVPEIHDTTNRSVREQSVSKQGLYEWRIRRFLCLLRGGLGGYSRLSIQFIQLSLFGLLGWNRHATENKIGYKKVRMLLTQEPWRGGGSRFISPFSIMIEILFAIFFLLNSGAIGWSCPGKQKVRKIKIVGCHYQIHREFCVFSQGFWTYFRVLWIACFNDYFLVDVSVFRVLKSKSRPE